MGSIEHQECPLCGRACPGDILERHHLRTRRKDRTAVALVCRECHKTIHGLFDHRELGDPRTGLDTVEGLIEEPRFAKALTFIRKLPPGAFMGMRQSRGKRGKGR